MWNCNFDSEIAISIPFIKEELQFRFWDCNFDSEIFQWNCNFDSEIAISIPSTVKLQRAEKKKTEECRLLRAVLQLILGKSLKYMNGYLRSSSK